MADENTNNPLQGKGLEKPPVQLLEGKELGEEGVQFSEELYNSIDFEKFRHARYVDNKTLQQQQSTISWVRWAGAPWLLFVMITFWGLSGFCIPLLGFSFCQESVGTSFLGASNVAIALIAAGTSAAVIGPMLVVYAVFRKKSPTGSLLESSSEKTKEASSAKQ